MAANVNYAMTTFLVPMSIGDRSPATLKRFSGTEDEGACRTTPVKCEKCGTDLKKSNSSCGCNANMVCPKCGHCNYCHGTKKCQEECCKTASHATKNILETRCKVCMDTGDCQQCLYR